MKKLKDVNLKDFAILTAVAFAWTKLGLSASVDQFWQATRIDPESVTGVVPLKPDGTCPAGWVKVGDKCVRL